LSSAFFNQLQLVLCLILLNAQGRCEFVSVENSMNQTHISARMQ